MENESCKLEDVIEITKVPISIVKKGEPYFFIKWARNDKRYRISASFKYLNTNYGLHINILRDFENGVGVGVGDADKTSTANKIKFLLSLINKLDVKIISDSLSFINYEDTEEGTEIFFIERSFNGENNQVLVFFSLRHWSLNDYLKTLKDN